MRSSLFHLFLLITIFFLSSCKLGRFVIYNKANITDYKIFPSRTIENPSSPFQFAKAEKSLEFDSVTVTVKKKGVPQQYKQTFEDYLTENKTVAFLIIRNDTILYENYFNEYNEASIVNSFSMAKSFTSALIGCAIEDGLIQSVDQSVTEFIPELKKNGFDKVTIDHLLDMRSGIKFNEGYVNPFGHVASFYYGTNLRRNIKKLKLEKEPGTVTNYRSVDTQLLGLVLERALKDKTVSEYLEEKIWKPLQMEFPATWSLDRKKNGLEKTFCCINARARDFAKFGRLYLNNGNWDGNQIVPENWVEESTKIDESKGDAWYYNNQWWINKDGSYAAEGILGQFVSIHPENNLLIVRLGEQYGKRGNWGRLFQSIEKRLAL